jgi:hypothetical protein
MPLKTSDEKQDSILKVFDYFEILIYEKTSLFVFLLCLNNIHKACFHFLKEYTKHAQHGLFTWHSHVIT